MFYYRVANPKFKLFVKLVSLCAATVLFGFWLTASTVQADEYGAFDSSGQYNYHNSGSSLRPSIGRPGYEEERRAQERVDSEAERWRQEALRQEQRRQYAAPPANPNPFNAPEAVYGKDGQVTLCQKSFANTTYCR